MVANRGSLGDFDDGEDDDAWAARQLDMKLAAVAHPVRRFLLELLIWGDDIAGSLAASAADTFGISTSRASQHLQVLAHAGVVTVYPDGPTRTYRLNDAGLEEVSKWIAGLRRGSAAGR